MKIEKHTGRSVTIPAANKNSSPNRINACIGGIQLEVYVPSGRRYEVWIDNESDIIRLKHQCEKWLRQVGSEAQKNG